MTVMLTIQSIVQGEYFCFETWDTCMLIMLCVNKKEKRRAANIGIFSSMSWLHNVAAKNIIAKIRKNPKIWLISGQYSSLRPSKFFSSEASFFFEFLTILYKMKIIHAMNWETKRMVTMNWEIVILPITGTETFEIQISLPVMAVSRKKTTTVTSVILFNRSKNKPPV